MRLSVIFVYLLLCAPAVSSSAEQEFKPVTSGAAGRNELGPEYPVVFAFPDFLSARQLCVVRDAQVTGGVLRLTPALEAQVGAAWFSEKQPVCGGFATTFQFLLTGQDSYPRYRGADGFAFVVQNDGPAVIGNKGGASAFAGGDGVILPRMQGISRSVAVFFDTYKNSNVGDPSGNYVAICTTSRKHLDIQWPPRRLAYTRKLSVQLKDGRVHTVQVIYRPPVLFVFLDNPTLPILSAPVDLHDIVGPGAEAFVGFTAGTGSGYQNHTILNWSFACSLRANVTSTASFVDSSISFMKAACLPARSLCTPDQTVIEDRGSGTYHIVLPANLEWGARIPAPASAVGRIENASGTVCWDHGRRDSSRCNGPTGSNLSPARRTQTHNDLLAPESPAGALIWKTRQGWTYFSVNDRSGASFHDNEGYFEFEVQLVEQRP